MDQRTPAPAPDPAPGQTRPAPSATSPDLRSVSAAVVTKHTGNAGTSAGNAGSFKPGGIPWNKGLKMGMGSNPEAPPGSLDGQDPIPDLQPDLEPAPPQPPLVDVETVRRLVTLGLAALDKTLQINLAAGWLRLSGNKSFALEQAQFYSLKQEQAEAIALSAGLVAEKYSVHLAYLPEVALMVTAGTYGVSWLMAFNALKEAATAAAAEKKPTDKPPEK